MKHSCCLLGVCLSVLVLVGVGCPWWHDQDTTPPASVSAFAAVAGNGQIALFWSNPSDEDFQGTRVARATGAYPASPTDGTAVYEGAAETFTDTGLTNGTPYFYSAFAYDGVPNYAPAAQATATPQEGAEGEGEGEGEGEFAGFLEVPAPLSGDNPTYKRTNVAVPGAGQSVVDPDFGTTQRRVVGAERLRNEYSRLDPFNADRSMILLLQIAEGEWRVYRTDSIPYDQAANLVATVAVEEPRWDPANPDLLWGIQDFALVTVSLSTKQATVVKNFAADPAIAPLLILYPDLYRITMRDEGESSADKRYWAFAIQGSNDDYRVRYLFTWDREANEILGLYTLPVNESRIDWVGMSWKGTWVLIGGDWDNAGNLEGLVMANKGLTQFLQLDYATAHADIGLDSDGNEVLVMQGVRTDYIDLIPLEMATTPITSPTGDYTGTNRTPLLRLFYDSESAVGFNSGVHISCNYPGWCVVSTYTEPGVAEQNWLDRKVVLIKLDRANPRVFYLARVYGTRGAYWEETQATMSRDGSCVVWATNWNQHVGDERVWLMQLAMPAGWASHY